MAGSPCGARRRPTPAVLCTGFSRTVTPESARALGVRRYLSKPATLAELGRAGMKELYSGAAGLGPRRRRGLRRRRRPAPAAGVSWPAR